ncbi:MAG: glucoamylase family protein [Salinivirgaceae bacterium]
MKNILTYLISFFLIIAGFSSCNDNDPNNPNAGTLQLSQVKANSIPLSSTENNTNILVTSEFTIEFNSPIDTNSAKLNIVLINQMNEPTLCLFKFEENNTTIRLQPLQDLNYQTTYTIQILSGIKGSLGETFPGINYTLITEIGILEIQTITLNGYNFQKPNILQNISRQNDTITIQFSAPLNPSTYQNSISLSGVTGLSYSLSDENKQLTTIVTSELTGFKKYTFNISNSLTSQDGFTFSGFSNYFYTTADSTPKFSIISDDELLTLIQKQTFKFFWDYGHPVSGLARERTGSGDVVTSGGSGFGLMAILVGLERGFITRQEGYERLDKIVTFLNNPQTDKFHGAFPHWLNGSTGKVIPFSTKDNGADLVETSYLMQGLLTVREYFKNGSTQEQQLCDSITQLWENVEWSWFRRGTQNVLYWHWSPNYGWDMNMQIQGWSECLIVYVMAASSPTFGIPKEVYTNGWARNGAFPMKNGKSFYGITLPLSWDYGGPLFWAHYSFLGLDPRNLQDQYANYWEQNVAHSSINFEHCKSNPKKYVSYSADCWGLTACDIPNGYAACEPNNDKGVIAPTAAISSIAYTPEESLDALQFFYYVLGDKLWGEYGFYDSFDVTNNWWARSYLAIDQGPEICMIENYRSALLWNLFMGNTEVQNGLTKLGFTY